MDGHRTQWSDRRKWNFLRRLRKLTDGRLRQRYLIVYHRLQGANPTTVARCLACPRQSVYRVWARFTAEGEAGLVDRREDNGEVKVDEAYLGRLRDLVRGTPPDFGWRRPTWTRELLIRQMALDTGVQIAPSTMSRALKAIGARRGRPRPTVKCPWSKRRRERRVWALRALMEHPPPGHVVVAEDEADIDLNAKIGYDWMLRGEQKEVPTPGRNVKRYVAGALEVGTGRWVWVFGERKASGLFVSLLETLGQVYREAKVIHVILDNARLHTSQYTQRRIEGMSGRIILHFLPPYCPNDNPIERVWRDLHENVTRNHQRRTIEDLIADADAYLRERSAASVHLHNARFSNHYRRVA